MHISEMLQDFRKKRLRIEEKKRKKKPFDDSSERKMGNHLIIRLMVTKLVNFRG